MIQRTKGAQSIAFSESPYIMSSASVVGKKESEGPLGKYFDMTDPENLFGEETWEAAEGTMQKEACTLAIGKAELTPEKIRYLFGGDLLRQGIATSMGLESGGRIWGAYAGSDIQPFRNCGEGVPVSLKLCKSASFVCTVDGDRQRRLCGGK